MLRVSGLLARVLLWQWSTDSGDSIDYSRYPGLEGFAETLAPAERDNSGDRYPYCKNRSDQQEE